MSWCDKLASTPAVGLRFTPNFVPSDQILANLASFLNEQIDGDRATFNIESLDAFAVSINTDEGFKYNIDHANVSIVFNHRVRAKATSGGPPVMELISRAAPYTDLLTEVLRRVSRTAMSLAQLKGRGIKRVGIVSVTSVDLDDAPPGIQALFKQIACPMGGKLDHMNASIGVTVAQSAHSVDRCVHTLVLPEDKTSLVTIQLDWQRTFNDSVEVAVGSLENILGKARSDALEYFERVAEGGLSDGSDS